MPTINEQQLSLVGQALSIVVKQLEPNSMEAKELITECNQALNILSSIGKKQGPSQLVGGAASILSAHKRCCSTCSSGEIKDLLSRFIRQ